MKNDSETPSFKCQQCDVKVDTISMLKFHVRTLHMSSVQIQTDEKETKEQKEQTDTRLFKPLKLKKNLKNTHAFTVTKILLVSCKH